MEITGLGWCGTRMGSRGELGHFYEQVLGLGARVGADLATGPVAAASGQQQVGVGLQWNLRGTGTRPPTAIFRFSTPGVTSARSASSTCQ